MADESTTYRPDDQREKLGPPPWKPDDPALIAWEAAHGHDVRLSCEPIWCEVALAELEAKAEALAELEAEVRRFFAQQPHTDVMHSDAYREAYPRIAALLRADGNRR